MNRQATLVPIIILLIFSSFAVKGQYFSTGQPPASIKWLRADTEHFRYIFPANDTAIALKLINSFEKVYEPVRESMHVKPRKTPVILHSSSIISNGLVVWAPRRTEIFPNLSQDMPAFNNIEHLAIHEYRHVVQMNKLHQGTGKFLHYLFGEQSVGILTGLFIPLWFLEGDAVCSETAFSNSGRGRIAEFTNKYKALLLEKDKYAYDKAVYGSYKDFVPNHYELGYFMTAQARKNYGKNIWSDVLNNVARKPYLITPFNNGIKKATGLNKAKLYNAIMDTLKQEWLENKPPISYYETITRHNLTYTTYDAPSIIFDSLFIAKKSSLDENGKIVFITKNGKEKKIFLTGNIIKSSISHNNKWLAFVEYETDIRWHNRSYSNIILYNLETNKRKALTRKSRYQTSAVCSNGEKIAAVYTTSDNKTGLHILELQTGKILKDIRNDDNEFIITPSWCEDDRHIVCVLHNGKGKAFGIINTETEIIKPLTPFENNEIKTPSFYKNYLLYVSDNNGIDNAYALDTTSGLVYQLTSSQYGAHEISYDDILQRLIYINNTADGNELVYCPYDSLLWEPINNKQYFGNTLFETLKEQENHLIDFDTANNIKPEWKSYRKLGHLFNFHSWAPVYINTDNNELSPGVVFMSQNHLNTSTTTTGYKYNPIEETGKFILNYEYAGFYPVLNTALEHGKRKIKVNDDTSEVLATENRIINGLRLPLNLSEGAYLRQFQVYINSNIIQVLPDLDTIKDFKLHALDYGVYFRNSTRNAHKDLFPRLGQVFHARYAHNITLKDDRSEIFGMSSSLYFPGIFKNNSLFLTASYQKRLNGSYTFNYIFPFPRGFNTTAKDFKSIMKISTNYALPLIYPDISLGSLIYLKRIRSLMFFDYAEIYQKKDFLRSYGIELLIDVHLFRFIAPLEIGVRSLYRQHDKTWLFEPLFSVNFDSF